MPAHRSVLRFVAICIAAFALAGCAATSFVSEWADDSYAGKKLTRVLIVGVVKDASLRRQFEDEFVRQARAAGVDVVQSYRYVPEDGPVPEDRLRKAVAESGADGVVVSAVQRVDQQVQYSPGYYAGPPVGFGYYGFYRWGYAGAYVPPTAYVYMVVYVETQLHAVQPDTLLWAGTTKTIDPSAPAKEIPAFTKLILDALLAKRFV